MTHPRPPLTRIEQEHIAQLQRELITLLKGDLQSLRAQLAVAALNGDFKGSIDGHEIDGERIRALRARILSIDPRATVFEAWGGPMPLDAGERRSSAFGDLSNAPELPA